MTRLSFRRDCKFIVLSILTFPAINSLFASIAIKAGTGHVGPLTYWPLWLAVPVALIVVEFFQYWQHRLSHELQGRFGGLLWRIHAGQFPDRIGVAEPSAYPHSNDIWRVMKLPFSLREKQVGSGTRSS